MYDDLARTQRPSYLEWFVAHVFVPSVLITFALQTRADPAATPRDATYDTTSVLPLPVIDEWHPEPLPELFPVLVSMRRPTYRPFLGSLVEVRVVLKALVEPDGSVSPSSIFIVQSPDPQFNEAARLALIAAVFQPARMHGHPIAAWITIAVSFDTCSSGGTPCEQ